MTATNAKDWYKISLEDEAKGNLSVESNMPGVLAVKARQTGHPSQLLEAMEMKSFNWLVLRFEGDSEKEPRYTLVSTT